MAGWSNPWDALVGGIQELAKTAIGLAYATVTAIGYGVGGHNPIAGFNAGYRAGYGAADDVMDGRVGGTSTSFTSKSGLRGSSNSLNKDGTPPLILGTHYITPPLIGRPYTEIAGTDGADQYLHLSYLIGYGPLEVRELRIGENLLASNSSGAMGSLTIDGVGFDGVQAELRFDSTDMTYYPKRVTEVQFDEEMKSPGGTPTYLYQTTPAGCTKIEVDFEFPNGIAKGTAALSTAVNYKAEYQAAGGNWSSPLALVNDSKSAFVGTTARYSYASGALIAGKYDVRVYRVTADSTDTTVRDSVHWTALRSTMAASPLRPGISAKCVRLSIRAKASDYLNGNIGKVSCIATAKIPIYSGTGTGRAQWTTVAATSNPAAIAMYLLRGDATGDGLGVGPNPQPYVDANIDYPAYEALYNYVAGRAATKPLTCNAVIDKAMARKEAIAKVLATARAVPIKRGSINSLVLDSERTTPVALINPRNTADFQATKDFPDIPHGYRVGFVNAAAGYQADQRIVLADGYIYDVYNDGNLHSAFDLITDPPKTTSTIYQGITTYKLATKLEQVDRWGKTDADEVFREVRCTLAALTLRPEVYSVKQDFQALSLQYGDLVRFGHDVPEFGIIGGRVKTVTLDGSGNATAFVSDEIITMEAGKSYSIAYQRCSDGRVLFAPLVTVATSTYVASFATPIAAADIPAIEDLYHYGEGTEGGTIPAIVVGLEPGDDYAITVHLQDYGAGIFTADTGTIPAFNSNITLPVEHNFAQTWGLKAQSQTVARQAAQATTIGAAAAAAAQAAAIASANATAAALIPTNAPKYLGIGQLAATGTAAFAGYSITAPTFIAGVITANSTTSSVGSITPTAGQWMVNYAGAVTPIGVYLWNGSAWTQTGVTAEMRSAALEDLFRLTCFAPPITVAEGTTLIEMIAYRTFTKYLKIITGGSMRGGDRYDETGAVVDGTKSGFFIGASGACKVAGMSFEGSQGGGVQWGGGQQVGTGLTISGTGVTALTALNATDVAFIDENNKSLSCYRFNGSTWSLIGSSLTISGTGYSALAALNATDVAFVDSTNNGLSCYRFNGSTWSLIGSSLTISSTGAPALTSLNGTDVAFIDWMNDELRCYRFNGSTWQQVASAGSSIISGTGYSALAALNGTDVAFIDNNNKSLRCYRFAFALSIPWKYPYN